MNKERPKKGKMIHLVKDGVLNITELEKVLCKCGHSIMKHYYCEGCCDRGDCDCKRFEEVVQGE